MLGQGFLRKKHIKLKVFYQIDGVKNMDLWRWTRVEAKPNESLEHRQEPPALMHFCLPSQWPDIFVAKSSSTFPWKQRNVQKWKLVGREIVQARYRRSQMPIAWWSLMVPVPAVNWQSWLVIKLWEDQVYILFGEGWFAVARLPPTSTPRPISTFDWPYSLISLRKMLFLINIPTTIHWLHGLNYPFETSTGPEGHRMQGKICLQGIKMLTSPVELLVWKVHKHSPWKWGGPPKRKRSSSNNPFSGAKMLVSERETHENMNKHHVNPRHGMAFGFWYSRLVNGLRFPSHQPNA